MSVDTYVVNTAGKPVILKDPDALLDYTFDWSAWLTDLSDTIVSATVTPDAGLTLNKKTVNTTNVIAWLQGGTLDQTYAVACEITTVAGRIDERRIYLKIKDR